MSDFLTEKNKKTGILGKLKWVLCGFFILFSLGAIGASEKYIGEGRWGMAATEIILGLLFLYPTFREIQKALKKKKAGEIDAVFEIIDSIKFTFSILLFLFVSFVISVTIFIISFCTSIFCKYISVMQFSISLSIFCWSISCWLIE